MKIQVMAILIGLAGITGMSACTKCKVCTKNNSPEVRLCEKDYNSETEYGAAVDAKEADGYDCTESP